MKKRRATSEPSDLELQVLAVLWEHGPLPARRVLELLPDGKRRAYTSVLSVMQVMEKKGLLMHTAEGKTHVYSPKVSRGRVLGGVVGRLVDLVFGGKPSAVVQALIDEKAVSKEELVAIKKLIEAKEKGV